MANIYDVAAAIKQPDIVGNFNQGVQTAQQNQVFGERQQAYQQAQADQQNIRALAPQIIAGDPAAADQAAAIDPDAAAKYQGVADQHLKRLSGAISYIDSQKDPQAKEAAYQQVRPFLAQFGQQPPATFAEAEPKMEAARAQIAMLGQPKSDLINVGAGGAVFDPKTRQLVYQNPGVAKTPGIVSVNLPDGSTQQYQQNPDGSLAPLRLAGQGAAQPQGPMQTTITPASPANVGAADQANALLAQGKSPQEVMQTLIQAHPDQKFQLAIDPQTGQFKDVSDGSAQFSDAAPTSMAQLGRSSPKQKGESYRQATPEEIAQHGLPAGTSAQIASNGKFDVINKGDTTSGLTDDASEMLSSAAMQGYKIPIPSLGMKSGGDRTKFLNTLAKDIKVSGVDVPTAVRNMVYGESGIFATKAMQKNYGVTMQNEMSAQNQAQIALDASSKMQRSDIQALNQMWLTGKKQFGSADAQNYANAINTFAEEYAKVMSGANGSAAATDSSRAKAHEMINTGLSQGQMEGVVALMKKEMRGRTQGQLDAIQSQVRGLRDFGADSGGEQNAQPAPSQATSTQAPQQNASPAAQPRAVNSMGHVVVWNGSAWVPE